MKTIPPKTRFHCQACGHQAPRWSGRCPGCGEWNSMKEEVVRGPRSLRATEKISQTDSPMRIGEIVATNEMRLRTGLRELDRVLGGGVVPGSITLIGGDPGIGKTTLLLQALPLLASGEEKILYVSGEESTSQMKMRSDRLGLACPSLYVFSATSLEDIFKAAADLQPIILVVDSIQTAYTEEISSAPGSVSQVQEVAYRLMGYAKRTGVPVFIIGHVTKEGSE